MMVEFRKLGRNDHNYAVFLNGRHVDALVTLMDNPDVWVLWKDRVPWSRKDREAIDAKLRELNALREEGK